MSWIIFIVVLVAVTAILLLAKKSRRSGQLAYIRNYHFHKSIRDKINMKYPHLNDEQSHLVFRALTSVFNTIEDSLSSLKTNGARLD